jgi:mannose/fructose/N-acetylgalactosamine-specific phosphotransferase system component IIB
MRNFQLTDGGKMYNIVLTRIDDRLLHGQVVVSWIPFLKVNEVLIIDNEYAEDEFMSCLIKEASPDSVTVNVLTVENSANYLKELKDNEKKILILSRYIENIIELINLNININKINIGGLGHGNERKKYINAIHLSDKELALLNNIAANGVDVEFQTLPNDKALKLGN